MMALVFGRKKDGGGIPGLGSLSGSAGATPSARPSGIPGGDTSDDATTKRSSYGSGSSAAFSGAAGAGGTGALGGAPEPWEIGPWTIRIFALLFFTAFTLLFVNEEHRRLHDPTQMAARGDITYNSADSLIRQQNLVKAMAAVKAKSPANGTVESLRITPTRIDVTVAQPDGAQWEYEVGPDFKVSKDTYPADEPEGLPFSKIPLAVPQHLLTSVQAKLHLQPANLDYILLNPRKDFDGKRDDEWGAYYSKPPLHNDATAALDGTDVRLIGTPDAATRASIRANARTSLKSIDASLRQVKRSAFPSEAMRKQSIAQLQDARARVLKSLQEGQ